MGATVELKQLKELNVGSMPRRRTTDRSNNRGDNRADSRAEDRAVERATSGRLVRESAALRLLSAERSEEIFPILLEEIVNLGYPRALALEVNFETGEFKPKAALNCSKSFQQQCSSSLWAHEHPLVAVLNSMEPHTVRGAGQTGGLLYCYPLLYRNRSLCWEAERERKHDCLAVQNFHSPRKLRLEEQVCTTCHMRAYSAMVVTEFPGSTDIPAGELKQLRALIEMANRYLSRLFKVEHYYNRMRDMDVTIAQMHTVMNSMADPVILTDTHHRVIMQNRAAERFFRLPEQVSEGGARAVEFNNLLFSAALSSLSVSGAEGFRDLTLVDVIDGDEVLFEAVCAPTYGPDGRRSGMVTVMRDVTDLRRADQEMRASMAKLQQAEETVRQDRDRLNLVIEGVGDPIVVADASARVVLLDPLAKQLFGAAEGAEGDTAVPRDPAFMNNLARLDAYLTRFTFSFEDKHAESLSLFNPSMNTDVEYEVRSGKIYDKRGQVSFTVNVLRDFSAWKKVEELKMQTRMLEMEKFAATGRLAGTIAHEINNPMEAIKNSIHLLGRHVDPNGAQLYDLLNRETGRVARIVRQMLGLYRANDRPMAFDLNQVIEDTLVLFARQLERAGVAVQKELGEIPLVVGSADQMRQVVSNLVVNARDSMASGGRMRVRTRLAKSADGTQGLVRILVADTGTGIPRNLQKDMFEPFVSTKGERGTGLGLWIVKGVVENHAGKIHVRSREGKGTVFQLEIPVVRSL
jgi:signal transduction histidine kinase